jgi:hypothetical protein
MIMIVSMLAVVMIIMMEEVGAVMIVIVSMLAVVNAMTMGIVQW